MELQTNTKGTRKAASNICAGSLSGTRRGLKPALPIRASRHGPVSAAAARPGLLRHWSGAHLQGLEPRQPDALRTRIWRQLHLHDRRQLRCPGSARRYLQEPPAFAALQLEKRRRARPAGRLPSCGGGTARSGHRAAKLSPSVASGLCAWARTRQLVAGAGRALRLPGADSLPLLHQPGDGGRHRHVRPQIATTAPSAAADRAIARPIPRFGCGRTQRRRAARRRRRSPALRERGPAAPRRRRRSAPAG